MESEKYNKVLNILKKSKPILDTTEDIEKEVFKRINRVPGSRFNLSEVIDFLFGWVYIGWVRRSFIAASVVLVLVFIYQQSVILKQINYLNRQIVITGGETTSSSVGDIEKGIMMYKLSGRRFPAKSITISDKQMRQLLESVNELQTENRDLLNMIEGDPELKTIIEKKLIENSRTKIKL